MSGCVKILGLVVLVGVTAAAPSPSRTENTSLESSMYGVSALAQGVNVTANDLQCQCMTCQRTRCTNCQTCQAGDSKAGRECKDNPRATSGCYSSLDDYDCLCNWHRPIPIPPPPTPAPEFVEEAWKRGVANLGQSFAVAMADINNDEHLDIFVTNSGSSNALYINSGNGEFKDVTSYAGLEDKGASRGAVFADVNGDGILDLFVSASQETNHLYLGDGQAKFKDLTTESGVGDPTGFGQGACFADVDGDGDLDLFVANFGQSNTLYLNNGKGIFTNATSQAGLLDDGVNSFGCAFGDADEDGDLDLYVSNDGSYNNFYLNDGKGNFKDVAEIAGVQADKGKGRAVSFADLNNDGYLDLFMVAPVSRNRIFFGQGTGHFIDGCSSANICDLGAAQGFNIADVDGDGDLDVYVTNILEPNHLYLNDGTGKFSEISKITKGFQWPMFGQGAAFGDVDGDGLLDMYVNTWGTPPLGKPPQPNKLFVNKGSLGDGKAGPWLKVRPVSATGAATQIGTEVRLFNAGTRTPASVRMQTDGGSSFASQNAYDLYFGLSKSVSQWPWGTKSFDIEVRCGGRWMGKETYPELGGVEPNYGFRAFPTIVKVSCSKHAMVVSV